MIATAPTFHQIKAQVAAIRQKIPEARIIGIRAEGRWTDDRHKQDGNETYVIEQCDSPLALRIALRGDSNQATTKVLITSLDDKDLSEDILLRLTKRRLFPLEGWEIVKTLFQARTIDQRVTRHYWIADLLMTWRPPAGYPPVSSGFLDAETVWAILLQHGIGLATEHPDLQAVLRWSLDLTNVNRYRAASDAFREAAVVWLSESAGPVIKVVLDCVKQNERPDALPLGLALGVLFHPQAQGRVDKAVGKLEERYFGGVSLDEGMIGRWHAAASEVARLQVTDFRQKRQLVQRADEILGEVGAESFAYLSDTSPLGFDLRLASLGKQLTETLSNPHLPNMERLSSARQSVLEHDRAHSEQRRLERISMAMRLVRWLAHVGKTIAQSRSLAEAIASQNAEGSFVDWARLALRSGDPVRELSEAHAKLFEKVTAVREQQAQQFALLLKEWTASGSTGDRIVPVEHVLESVVTPLASHAPVLLVIIDGMSLAVCRELVTALVKHDWVVLSRDGQEAGVMTGLATIPSVTEASRTSLLCGQLRRGSADDERAGFAAHPGLLAHCRNGSPPVLFHKPSLRENTDDGLANEVRQAITSSHRRIVGVVVNAVDDHLLKGDQIDTRWTRDEIKVLPALLHEAKTAQRLVILLSDHGHVLDAQTEGKLDEGGERWRLPTRAPEERELQLSGTRVLLTDAGTLIAPWSERLRYGVKKNGYHGGISPQEMIVPIVVLSSHGPYPDGWTEAPVDTPVWWDEPVPEEEVKALPPPVLAPIPHPQGFGPLFDFVQKEASGKSQPEEAKASPVEVHSEWIQTLLTSPLLSAQKKLAGRTVPVDEVFLKLLTALDRRGGKLTTTALARAMEYSPMRLPGLIAILQRILNIDGYAVLTRDEASDTIELNRELLCRQFDLVKSS